MVVPHSRCGGTVRTFLVVFENVSVQSQGKSNVWDIRYRPQKFSDVLGQRGTVQILQTRLRDGTALSKNYIFAGGHGQGKTTLARIMARAMLCQDLDLTNPEPCNECDNCLEILAETSLAFVERDAASCGTVDHMRALVEELPFAVYGASKRIHLFDEAHRMTRDAQDVLLKPLEENKLVGIFCTTEVEKIRATIRSRCEDYVIRKVTREDILVRMKSILTAEGVSFEDDAVLTVIDYSGGHVRDVLNRLEMIGQMGDVNLANVREYLRLPLVSTYYEIMLSLGNPQRAIELVGQACEQVSPQDVADGIAEAAMNSYRMANNMFADFVYVDRALGQKVYEAFGVSTLKLSEYFLQRRNTTRVNLFCDILNLAGGIPAPSAVGVPMAPPIQVVTAAPVQATAPVQAPVISLIDAVSAHPGLAVPVGSVSPAVQVLPEVKKPEKKPDGTRFDGVGPIGSGDVCALTELDHKGVPVNKARGRNHVHVPVSFPRRGDPADDLRMLTPDEWRREFERTWPSRG